MACLSPTSLAQAASLITRVAVGGYLLLRSGSSAKSGGELSVFMAGAYVAQNTYRTD